MRTKTLLLLAVGCGLVILLAGGIQLLRVGGQEQSTKVLTTGQRGKAGDVTVELLSTTIGHDDLSAVVRVGGVDDPDGLDGFTLVAPGKVVPLTTSSCEGIAVAQADCVLTFSTADLQGTSRQLIFHRADQQLRWVLARSG
ncbi:MAG TPA: hypothetical protein VIH06_13460 [Ilumatobacteraceae bacterium]